jgi:hypothetical protein
MMTCETIQYIQSSIKINIAGSGLLGLIDLISPLASGVQFSPYQGSDIRSASNAAPATDCIRNLKHLLFAYCVVLLVILEGLVLDTASGEEEEDIVVGSTTNKARAKTRMDPPMQARKAATVMASGISPPNKVTTSTEQHKARPTNPLERVVKSSVAP